MGSHTGGHRWGSVASFRHRRQPPLGSMPGTALDSRAGEVRRGEGRERGRTLGPGHSPVGRRHATTAGKGRRSASAAAPAPHRRIGGRGARPAPSGWEREARRFFPVEESGRRIGSPRIYLVGWLRSRSRSTPSEAEEKPIKNNKKQ